MRSAAFYLVRLLGWGATVVVCSTSQAQGSSEPSTAPSLPDLPPSESGDPTVPASPPSSPPPSQQVPQQFQQQQPFLPAERSSFGVGVGDSSSGPPAALAQSVVVFASPAPPAPPVPDGDPNADRVVLLPTAYTHPRGTFFVSDYDVVFFQAGYGLTDDTQISVSALPPLGRDGLALLDVTLKTSLLRDGLVRLAALGSASGALGKEVGVLAIGRIGGVVQLCLSGACDSSFSLSSNVTLAGPVLVMVNGVGIIWRAGRTVSLVGEVITLVPIGREAGQWNGIALAGGVRFSGSHWAFDASLMRALVTKTTVPLLALTYRH